MKKLIKLSIQVFILLFTLNTYGQGWEKSYTTPFNSLPNITDSHISIDQNSNGHFIILPEGCNHFLKIDLSGDSIWGSMTDVGGLTPSGDEIFAKDNLLIGDDGNYITIDEDINFKKIQIIKYLKNGDTIFTKILDGPGSPILGYTTKVKDTRKLQDGNIIVVASVSAITSPGIIQQWIKISKIDYTNGHLIWEQDIIDSNKDYSARSIVENPDKTLTVYAFEENNLLKQSRLVKIDTLGNQLWNKAILTPNASIFYYGQKDLERTNDNGYVITQRLGSGLNVVKTDSLGNELWRTVLSYGINGYIYDILVTSDNDILLAGHFRDPFSNGKHIASISKLKNDGTISWEKLYLTKSPNKLNEGCSFMKIIEANNNEFIAVAMGVASRFELIYAVKIDSLGRSNTNLITGNVYNDLNLDCIQGSGENNLNSSMIRLVENTDTSFHLVDTSGNFELSVGLGNYEITALPLGAYWQTCPSQTVIFTNHHDTSSVSLGLQASVNCSDLVVHITTPRLIRCFSNTYHVNYCNVGTVAEPNAYIEIELDSFLIVDTASVPYTQSGNIYTFQIGFLDISKCGHFFINTTVDCNAYLGQTHCVEANIYPQQVCTPAGNWNGAMIVVDAACEVNDSVRFSIENIGASAMTQSQNYYVLEDQVLLMQGTFNLLAGQDTSWTLSASPGAVYRIEAEQEATHPWVNTLVSDITFGCNALSSNLNVLVNQFALDDYLNFVDVDCQQNVGSYDPNDKNGYPVGYGMQHYITKTDKIEYLIRFQNTGTFTAFNVVIKDTIDLNTLDLTTLQIQGSSHPYTFNIENNNTLKFTFTNIMLPDSNSNEPASHGFIRFKIGQKTNNTIGTIIKNSAAIYFDFNEAVITNTTFHTIGKNFIQVVSSTKPETQKLANVKVYPNPFTQQATFEIETEENYKTINLMVFDMMGRIVKTLSADYNNQLILDRNGLTSGVYFYKLVGDEQVLDSGKLMVQ